MSSTGTIQTGYYTIKSAQTGAYIGRHAFEDRSFGPKPIVVDPQPQIPEKITFYFEKVGDNIYAISCAGADTAAISTQLFAVLQRGQGGTTWRVEYDQRSDGQNRFVIRNFSGNWRMPFPNEDDDQIKVSPVPIPAVFPPFFPDFIVWIIEPADEPGTD